MNGSWLVGAFRIIYTPSSKKMSSKFNTFQRQVEVGGVGWWVQGVAQLLSDFQCINKGFWNGYVHILWWPFLDKTNSSTKPLALCIFNELYDNSLINKEAVFFVLLVVDKEKCPPKRSKAFSSERFLLPQTQKLNDKTAKWIQDHFIFLAKCNNLMRCTSPIRDAGVMFGWLLCKLFSCPFNHLAHVTQTDSGGKQADKRREDRTKVQKTETELQRAGRQTGTRSERNAFTLWEIGK